MQPHLRGGVDALNSPRPRGPRNSRVTTEQSIDRDERAEKQTVCGAGPDVVLIWTRPRPCGSDGSRADGVPCPGSGSLDDGRASTSAAQVRHAGESPEELTLSQLEEFWFRPVTEPEAGELLGLSAHTLKNWRKGRPGFGPGHLQMGSSIRYRRKDLRDWMDKTLGAAPERPRGSRSARVREQAPAPVAGARRRRGVPLS